MKGTQSRDKCDVITIAAHAPVIDRSVSEIAGFNSYGSDSKAHLARSIYLCEKCD